MGRLDEDDILAVSLATVVKKNLTYIIFGGKSKLTLNDV